MVICLYNAFFTAVQPLVAIIPSAIGGYATDVFNIIKPTNRKELMYMNIADRIQQLRKTKGISQEQLADIVGVSRQAVSKWESEQSIPDIDKIIIMSEYFDVTTDYILKGIEPLPDPIQIKPKPSANIFAITGTAINLIGLIVGNVISDQYYSSTGIGIAFILMVMGCMIFLIGITVSDENSKNNAFKWFCLVNIWVIIYIPLAMIFTTLFDGRCKPSYIFILPKLNMVEFFSCYLLLGIIISFISLKLYKRHK